MKPYVVCHMISSLDGRIISDHWGANKSVSNYEPTGNSYKIKAWLVGRVTMEKHFAGHRPLKLSASAKRLPKTDHIAEPKAASFAIAIDKDGKLEGER